MGGKRGERKKEKKRVRFFRLPSLHSHSVASSSRKGDGEERADGGRRRRWWYREGADAHEKK